MKHDLHNTKPTMSRCLDDVELQLYVSNNESLIVRSAQEDSVSDHLAHCKICSRRERAMRVSFGRSLSRVLKLAGIEDAVFASIENNDKTAITEAVSKCSSLSVGGFQSGDPVCISTVDHPDVPGRKAFVSMPDASKPKHPENTNRNQNQQEYMNERKATLYALSQLTRDHEEKELAANWVITNFPLASGYGFFFDAGSQCLEVWRGLVQRIDKEHIENITALTSNLMVLQSWADNFTNAQLHVPNVQIAGERFDAGHLAFYGNAARDQLLSHNFRPAAVFIGAGGIEFDSGSIWLGYHAGDPERDAKKLLFQCLAKSRVILATPSKIGNAGGLALNILSIDNLDSRAPIYLVSVEPEVGSPYKKQYDQAEREMRSESVQKALVERGIVFHWIAINRESNQARCETYPKLEESSILPKA
jgi:DeoR/GlpR family transcriptional regulator of sugar metabolism